MGPMHSLQIKKRSSDKLNGNHHQICKRRRSWSLRKMFTMFDHNELRFFRGSVSRLRSLAVQSMCKVLFGLSANNLFEVLKSVWSVSNVSLHDLPTQMSKLQASSMSRVLGKLRFLFRTFLWSVSSPLHQVQSNCLPKQTHSFPLL